jgi:transposase-like protein
MVDNLPIHQMTAVQFEKMFPNEDACCAYLIACRWPEHVRCPRCGSDRVHPVKSTKWKWRCARCQNGNAYLFSHTTGTVFERTRFPLRNWFRVLCLLVGELGYPLDPTGTASVSILEIHRHASIDSYHAVWRLCARLRVFLQDPEFLKLMGIITVIEQDPLAEPNDEYSTNDTTCAGLRLPTILIRTTANPKFS